MSETKDFLDAAFGAVPPDQWFLIWTLPDRKSHWYRGGDTKRAAADIAKMVDRDVYVGAGLSSTDRGSTKRAPAAEVSGLIGLWADVDIEEFGIHRKSNLPASEEAAREVITSMGLAPTILVHSGHGLQAWWLFEEPWIFATEGERAQAARLSTMWHLTMRVRAATLSWTIDATQDLSRVMRMPGTMNHKGVPIGVRTLESDA